MTVYSSYLSKIGQCYILTWCTVNQFKIYVDTIFWHILQIKFIHNLIWKRFFNGKIKKITFTKKSRRKRRPNCFRNGNRGIYYLFIAVSNQFNHHHLFNIGKTSNDSKHGTSHQYWQGIHKQHQISMLLFRSSHIFVFWFLVFWSH